MALPLLGLAWLLLSAKAPAQEDGSSRALAYLQGELEAGRWNDRIHSVSLLEDYGVKGLPELSYAMGDADWQVRFTAVHVLGRLGRPALPALRRALERDPCRIIRITAVHWLGRIGAESLPVLREAAEDESGVASIYGRYWERKLDLEQPPGKDGKELIERAKYEDLNVCEDREEPGRMDGEERRPKLKRSRAPAPQSAEPEEGGETFAAFSGRRSALDIIKPEGAEELPAPAAALNRPKNPVKAEAAVQSPVRARPEPSLLGRSSGTAESLPDASTAEIRPALAVSTEALRQASARPAGPSAEREGRLSENPETLPGPQTLPERQVPDEGPSKAISAAPAGRPAYDPLPELLKALKAEDRRMRFRAADELGQLGSRAKGAVPDLMAALEDKSPSVRSSAALALGNIGKDANGSVPRLVSALEDKDLDVRSSAALALGRLGTPEARKAFSKYLRREAQLLIDRGQTVEIKEEPAP